MKYLKNNIRLRSSARETLSRLVLVFAIVTSCLACKSRRDYSDDSPDTLGGPSFVIDASSTLASHTSVVGPVSQTSLTQRVAFLQTWVDDSNSWFLPFAARYIPRLNLDGQKRILPVINKDPLLVSINSSDVAVNLLAPEWSDLPEDDLTLLLRKLVVSTALEASVLLLQPPANGVESDEKNKLLRAVYLTGIPDYIISFGVPFEASQLAPALSGDRNFIEEQFEILRAPLLKNESPFDDRSVVTSTPDETRNATKQIGLWVCYQVEKNLGTEELIAAIAAGPAQLYQSYLSTNPGILMSLEALPVNPVPLEHDSITH